MSMFQPDSFVRKPRRGATATLGLAAAVMLAASIPAWTAYNWWAFRHELRRDWIIAGPPCPPATHSWGEIALSRQPRVVDYGGMHIAHLFGGADCSPVPEDYFSSKAYSVCQFTAPVMLAVTAAGRTTLFEPGYGRRATVTLRHGSLTCVLGGWFTL
jgi:hypothetical protein